MDEHGSGRANKSAVPIKLSAWTPPLHGASRATGRKRGRKGSSWAHSRTCVRVRRGSRGRDGRARRLVSADRASAERARSLPGNRVRGANTWMGSRPIICHSPTTLFTHSEFHLRLMLSIEEKNIPHCPSRPIHVTNQSFQVFLNPLSVVAEMESAHVE